MFYSVQILCRKGPLGTLWLAATLERRLKRQQVLETNLPSSVGTIVENDPPLALRLSGQLLLGAVKVYSKKMGYLFQDCNDALKVFKQAIKAGDIRVVANNLQAAHEAITLPEDYNDIFGAEEMQAIFAPLDADGPTELPARRDSFFLVDDDGFHLSSQSSLDGVPLPIHSAQSLCDVLMRISPCLMTNACMFKGAPRIKP